MWPSIPGPRPVTGPLFRFEVEVSKLWTFGSCSVYTRASSTGCFSDWSLDGAFKVEFFEIDIIAAGWDSALDSHPRQRDPECAWLLVLQRSIDRAERRTRLNTDVRGCEPPRDLLLVLVPAAFLRHAVVYQPAESPGARRRPGWHHTSTLLSGRNVRAPRANARDNRGTWTVVYGKSVGLPGRRRQEPTIPTIPIIPTVPECDDYVESTIPWQEGGEVTVLDSVWTPRWTPGPVLGHLRPPNHSRKYLRLVGVRIGRAAEI